MIHKKGDILLISRGAYDDYCIEGVFIACCEFDPTAVTDAYLSSAPEQLRRHAFVIDDFISYLYSNKYIISAKYYEWYVDDYDTVLLGKGSIHRKVRKAQRATDKRKENAEIAAHPERFVSTGTDDINVQSSGMIKGPRT